MEEALASGDWKQLRRSWAMAHATAPAAEKEAVSPLEIAQWVRERLRQDRDDTRTYVDSLSGPWRTCWPAGVSASPMRPSGDVLDILVQPRRNRHAAVRFFRRLLKNQRHVPRRLITDKLRSYSAACRAVMPSVLHCTDQYANNRAEASHQPTRQRERQMRCFTSAAQLQRFASVHGIVQNLFRVGRHLLRSAHHRLLGASVIKCW